MTSHRSILTRSYVIVDVYVTALTLIVLIVQARAQGAWAGSFFIEEGGGAGANRAKLYLHVDVVALLPVRVCVHLDFH